MSGLNLSLPPRWLHRWAVLTVCATLVLLFLGSVVTTFHVGMVDPVWPTAPWHLLFISWDEPRPGFLIEHGHRLAGYVVGCGVIVLALGLSRTEPRRWVRRLGWLALAGVTAQGILGGMRVKLNEWVGTDLALVHGCFAQIVFSLLTALALVTSPRWVAGCPRKPAGPARDLQRWTVLVAGLLYAQIVLGAVLRHTYAPLGQRGHMLVAFAATAVVVWLVKLAFDDPERSVVGPVLLLSALITVQICLGVEAWFMRFADGITREAAPQITIRQAAVRTAHVLTGFCIFAVSVVAALRARRILAEEARVASARSLEGTV